MPDIFLSYNREDQATARRFAEAFQSEGFEVWWDVTLRSGEAYDQVTEKALKTAKAVVVLWSPRSVESRWVRAEATLAERNKTLLPATIEACDRPIMFELTQTADLSAWDGSSTDKAWLSFLADVRRFVGAASKSPASATPAAAQPQAAPQPGRLSVCVLPFANMSGDAEQEYFADGISEDIITDLSKVSALWVAARNTAFTFKGKHVDVPQVARQLKVSHVLEGSVRKAGNRVRITAQLIEGETGGHVWADRFDRDLDDIFALQDEISQAIVGALKLKLFPQEKQAIKDRGTANVEAYDLFLRARALHHQQGRAELRRAIQIYREALALDPGFVLAWLGLHGAHLDALVYDSESIETALEGAAEAATRVLALSPDAWWSHALRSGQFAQQRRWMEAEAAARAALDSAPASDVGAAAAYAGFLTCVGRAGEAAEIALRLLQADPLSLFVSATWAQFLLDAVGRYDEAEAEYQRSKDLSGDRDIAEYTALTRALVRGDGSMARTLVGRVMTYETVPIAGLGDLAEVFDQPGIMLAQLRKARTDPANQISSSQLKIALWATHHGDLELATTALRAYAIDLRATRIGAIWHPILSAARKTPAFKALARELGFYDYWRASGHWGDFARPVGDDDFEIIR
jgi:TolB-like protein